MQRTGTSPRRPLTQWLSCSHARRNTLLQFTTVMLLFAAQALWAWSPVANNDSYTVAEDTLLTVNAPGVLANDTDADGQALTAIRVSNPAHGTLTFNANGSFSYRPATNYNGPDSFTYQASDGSKLSGIATVSITVQPVNDAPVANNDSYATTQNVSLTITAPGVLANDTDPEGSVLRSYLATASTHGTVTLSTNGSFVYAPQSGYVGTDTFTYKASDGSATSGVATVTITIGAAPIVVNTPPKNQTNCPGATVVFSVTATGTGLTYQWFRGTNTLAGKTNNTLTLANITLADAGTYSVKITSGANSVTPSATLTVNTPVSATSLVSLMRFIGSTAIFSTTPSGTGPFTYSWRKNGSVIAGQTGNSLTLLNVGIDATATYSVVVSGACGSVTNSATLMVDACFPSVDVVLVIDRSGSMSGKPYEDAKLACSNFVNNLKFGTNADLVGLVSYNTNATLDRRLTNDLQSVRQGIASIPPAGGNTSISSGLHTAQDELASVRHNSNALPVLVLLSDGLPTGGDTSSSALNEATQAKNAGTRVFTVGLGAVDHALMGGIASSTNDYFYTTNSSQLTALFNAISTIICRPPTNIFGPSNTVVCSGSTVTLNVSASGCDSFTFQWSKDGALLAGQTNNSLILPNVAPASAGVYSVEVRSVCRTVTNSATLTVNTPALVVNAPANQISFVGSNAVFNVNASGTGLSYQWFFNGALVGTNSTLALNNLTTNRAGNYCVVIRGVCGGPVTNCATLTIQNRAPIANNDNYTVAEDSVLTIAAPGVLANDSDPDGDAFTAVMFTGPSHGTVTLNADGSFVYQPAANYNGPDSFTYKATDGTAASSVATVSITVTPVNDAPVARDDAYMTPADTTLTIAAPGVLANDTDVENNPLSAILVSNPTHGTLTLSANGSFVYVPNTNFSGNDVFTYKATDLSATSGVATVTITVSPAQIVIITPPVNQTNCPGGTASFNVTASGTALTYQWLRGTNVLIGQTNRTLVLPNVALSDAGSYCVVVNGAMGGPLTRCAVLVVNQNVIVVTPPSSQTNCPNTTATFGVTATGTALSYQWFFGGTLLNGQTNQTLTLANVTAVNAGVYTIVVSGACGTPATNSATLTVNQNVAITAAPTPQTSFVGSNVVFTVGATGTGLTYQWFFNGTLVGTTSTLTLNNITTNQAGIYCVVVSGTCGSPLTNCTTLTIQNRAPVANNDNYTTPEDTTLTIAAPGVLANDFDPDGNPLTSVLLSNVTHGVLTLNANGSFVYKPATNFNGVDTFLYRANDGSNFSSAATVRITVTPGNDAPVARDDSYTTAEDTALTIPAPGVLANDTDVDGDPLTAVIVSNPAHGTVTFNTNGGFVYRPNTNYNGMDTFTYRASDGNLSSGSATVTLTVTPVNDPPTTGIAGDNYSVLEDHVLTVAAPGVLANDSDIDGDPLTAIFVSGPAHGTVTLNSNGSFVYVPATNYFGVDNFTYVANDGQTNSAPAVVNITVVPVNDPPSFASAGDQKVNQNAPAQTVPNWASNISPGPANESAQTIAFTVSNDNPSLFLVQPGIAPNGTLTYTPATNVFGIATVHVIARDNGGTVNGGIDSSSEVIFKITVNSPPTVNIVSPINGSALLNPATFSVVADATDPDGTVTNVLFLVNGVASTNVAQEPFYFIMTNTPPGKYQFQAIATDNCGLAATSAVVTIDVITNAVVATGPIVFNNQNGLFEQFVTISNRTSETWLNGVRLFVFSLDTTNRVFNASGTNNNGTPYLDKNAPVAPGGSVMFLVQYYVPNPRTVPNPNLVAVPKAFTDAAVLRIEKPLSLTQGRFSVEFLSRSGRIYYVQRTDDFVHWKTVSGPIVGTGQRMQWNDNGMNGNRFYRILCLP